MQHTHRSGKNWLCVLTKRLKRRKPTRQSALPDSKSLMIGRRLGNYVGVTVTYIHMACHLNRTEEYWPICEAFARKRETLPAFPPLLSVLPEGWCFGQRKESWKSMWQCSWLSQLHNAPAWCLHASCHWCCCTPRHRQEKLAWSASAQSDFLRVGNR